MLPQKFKFASLALPAMFCVCAGLDPALAADDTQTKAMVAEYESGKYDLAFKRCVAILRADNGNLTAHYYLGNLYLSYHKPKQAAAEYNYCIAASKDAMIVEAAKKGLEAVAQHNAAPPPTGQAVEPIATVDPKIQEQIDRLKKECADQIAVKKKVHELNIERATQEMRDQYPRFIVGGQQGRMAWNETKRELDKERQGKLDRLNKQFARDSEELQAACDKRVNDLIEAQANVRKQMSGRR